MPFSEFLQVFLDKAHLSHNAFAILAGTSQGTVSKCVKGERPPPLEQLDKWASVLGIDDTTVTDEGDMVKPAFIRAGLRSKAMSQKEAMPYLNRLEEDLAAVMKQHTHVLDLLEAETEKTKALQAQVAELNRRLAGAP